MHPTDDWHYSENLKLACIGTKITCLAHQFSDSWHEKRQVCKIDRECRRNLKHQIIVIKFLGTLEETEAAAVGTARYILFEVEDSEILGSFLDFLTETEKQLVESFCSSNSTKNSQPTEQ